MSLVPGDNVQFVSVLILIILEVLYEQDFKQEHLVKEVLILIILEVLYELDGRTIKGTVTNGLNPYYTGSTL